MVQYEDVDGNVTNVETWRKDIEDSKITWSEHADTKEVLEEIANKWGGEMNGILYKVRKHITWLLSGVINEILREEKTIVEGEIINIIVKGEEIRVKIYTYEDKK